MKYILTALLMQSTALLMASRSCLLPSGLKSGCYSCLAVKFCMRLSRHLYMFRVQNICAVAPLPTWSTVTIGNLVF